MRLKLVDLVNNLIGIPEVSDTEIKTAIGKVMSQLKSLKRKVVKEEANVYEHLIKYLFRDQSSVIAGVKKEL